MCVCVCVDSVVCVCAAVLCVCVRACFERCQGGIPRHCLFVVVLLKKTKFLSSPKDKNF